MRPRDEDGRAVHRTVLGKAAEGNEFCKRGVKVRMEKNRTSILGDECLGTNREKAHPRKWTKTLAGTDTHPDPEGQGVC